ncbi:MAG: acyl-CoA/acyl-ACP dehydrogenase [Deltaproteobacteria bacterium]|nr:acyl-CoA/acyl-ACP dehydrogenase [Deltaproteobacteria bacterium]
MNFDLSEEQQLLQQTVGRFVANECPAARLREIFDGDEGHDPLLWKGLAEMGVAGLALSEEYGGAGLQMLDLAVVAETLGHGAMPGPFFNHAVGSLAIQLAGSEEQRQRWLPALAGGEAIATIALAEEGGWQPEDWTLQAGTTLSGVKRHVPLASLADLVVVGVAGGGFAVVERAGGGLSFESVDVADRTRRLEALRLEEAPCELLPEGASVAGRVRDIALVLLAADAFGGASRCVEMSVEYAKNREQFGVPIAQFQAVKHQLADMTLEVEPSRGLYWYAAHALDHARDDAPRTAAIAKSHITDRFMQVARDSVELHGGIGFTWECDLQIWFKRAMFDRAFLGNPGVHRARAAAMADW